MIKKFICGINLAIFLAGLIFTATIAASEATAATVDKTSIHIWARRRTGTYEEIEKRGYAVWGWTPQMDFRVNGPISEGGQLTVEFAKPDGKTWLKFNCETGAVGANQWWQVRACGQDLPEEQLARETGLYDLKISLKDELAGRGETLFTGKVKVGKFFAGGNQTSEKEHYGYYVDYDWRLAIGQVYAREPEEGYEDEYAPLAVSLWFRGDVQGEVSAHLFYKGREISNTKDTAKGTWLGETLIATFDDSKFNWRQQKFIFTNAFVYLNSDPENHPNAFRMDKNPGEYEIKVLRKGALARVLKFTVGADGKIADNGIARQNSLGNKRMIVPVLVSGDEQGAKPNPEAWRTEAFFNNPLKGFN
ncbi:MAG TPA: hypothetical protein VK400_08275 [Pyrinomonadaceae bacterium]|nr:hypothetical protein [Pyrinomonadaceae bacterium]